MCPLPVDIPNRPFSTERFTGMMLPDGFFETSLPGQRLNAQFRHTGGVSIGAASVYVEGTSHPGLIVTPTTHVVAGLNGGGVRLLTWDIELAQAPPGIHFVSFVVDDGAQRIRLIKKIFVTSVQYDAATEQFIVRSPEGELSVSLKSALGPQDGPLCRPSGRKPDPEFVIRNLIEDIRRFPPESIPDGTECCFPFYLLTEFELTFRHNPPFAGQYSDLPYTDPWWKTLLGVLCALLLIAAVVLIIAAGVVGIGILFVGGAAGPVVVVTFNCCVTPVAVALASTLVGAAVSGVAAALSDKRDPLRRGQDNTNPASGELTAAESVNVRIEYTDPLALGRPFNVHAIWQYQRITDSGRTYTYSVDEVSQNVHVLSRYEINAPDVVRVLNVDTPEDWVIEAKFFDGDGNLRHGDLFVQVILEGTGVQAGRFLRSNMQDDGIAPDRAPDDGTYTGVQRFTTDDRGVWVVYVLAQDINTADTSLSPEEAAGIVGGQILTHQLTINYSGGTCPLVPDGHVEVT